MCKCLEGDIHFDSPHLNVLSIIITFELNSSQSHAYLLLICIPFDLQLNRWRYVFIIMRGGLWEGSFSAGLQSNNATITVSFSLMRYVTFANPCLLPSFTDRLLTCKRRVFSSTQCAHIARFPHTTGLLIVNIQQFWHLRCDGAALMLIQAGWLTSNHRKVWQNNWENNRDNRDFPGIVPNLVEN